MKYGNKVSSKSNYKSKKNRVGGANSPNGDALLSSPLPFLNMYRGYFPLWRKIVDWGWYKDSNTKSVFIHLLLKTNREEKDYLGFTIYPGQCVTGRKKLSVDLGLSERQVRTALKHLKATNEITIKTTNKFSIITLNNYKKYLPEKYYNFKKETSKKSNNRPANDQQPTTTNKDKKEKKDNKRENPPKRRYGEFKKVLTDEELDKLKEKLGEQTTAEYIQRLDYYVGTRKDKYSSHYRVILKWVGDDKKKKQETGGIDKW
jgi:hypothetical protein